MTLRAAFLAAWKGVAPDRALDAALTSACERARAAWPGLDVDAARFCRHLAERAPEGCAADEALQRMRVDELYLALACAEGHPGALQAFDRAFLSRVPAYLARLRADDQLVEDTRQALRERLLLATAEAPPRIAQYGGSGALDAWVRVAAVRVALNLRDSQRRRDRNDTLDDQLLAADDDLELDYLRVRYRASFGSALKRAVAELPADDRALLRFHFVDGLKPGHIGALFGVHRTTMLRRIAAVREVLLERTRAHVMHELQVSPSECDSLVDLVRSQLPMTLSSLFRSAPE